LSSAKVTCLSFSSWKRRYGLDMVPLQRTRTGPHTSYLELVLLHLQSISCRVGLVFWTLGRSILVLLGHLLVWFLVVWFLSSVPPAG